MDGENHQIFSESVFQQKPSARFVVVTASVAFKEAWQFLATGPPERLFVQGLINETLLFTDGLLKLLADQY